MGFGAILGILVGVILAIIIFVAIVLSIQSFITKNRALMYARIDYPEKIIKFNLSDEKNFLKFDKDFLTTFNEYAQASENYRRLSNIKSGYFKRSQGYKAMLHFSKSEQAYNSFLHYRKLEEEALQILSNKKIALPDYKKDDNYNKLYNNIQAFCAMIRANKIDVSPFYPLADHYLSDGEGFLIFFPKFFLVIKGNNLTTCSYGKIEINYDTYIDGNVGTNGELAYTRWRYQRNDGGPDRRYSNNYSTSYYKHPDFSIIFTQTFTKTFKYLSFDECNKIYASFNDFKKIADLTPIRYTSSNINTVATISKSGKLEEYIVEKDSVKIKDNFNTIMENSFKCLDKIKSISITNKDLKEIKSNAFLECDGLEYLNINSSKTVKICDNAFNTNSRSLKRISINNATFSKEFYEGLALDTVINIEEYHGNLEVYLLNNIELLQIDNLYCGTKIDLPYSFNAIIKNIYDIQNLNNATGNLKGSKINLICKDKNSKILSRKPGNSLKLFEYINKEATLAIVGYNSIEPSFASELSNVRTLDLSLYENDTIDFHCLSGSCIKTLILPKQFKAFGKDSLSACHYIEKIIGFKPNKYNSANDALYFSNDYHYGEDSFASHQIKKVIIDKKSLTKAEEDILSLIYGLRVFIIHPMGMEEIKQILDYDVETFVLDYDDKDNVLEFDFTLHYNLEELKLPSCPVILSNKKVFNHCRVRKITINSICPVMPDNIFEFADNLKSVEFNTEPANFNQLKKKYKKIKFNCGESKKLIKPIENVTLSDLKQLSKKDKDRVTSIIIDSDHIDEKQFQNLISLHEVVFKSDINCIESYAFAGCIALEEVIFEGKHPTIFKSHCFENCFALKNISFIDNAEQIEEYAFSGCASIIDIDLPYSITNIKEGTFKNCFKLKTVFIPGSIQSIGIQAFCNCSELKEINGLDKVVFLEEECFASTNVEGTIVLPKTLKVYDNCFGDCSKLKQLVITGDLDEFNCNTNGCNLLKSLFLPFNIVKFNYSDAYDVTVTSRRGTNWRKNVKHSKFEYLSPDEFIDQINKFLLSNGYAVMQTDKKIKLKSGHDTTVINELYDSVSEEEPQETYDTRLRNQGAFWDTAVVSEANKKVEKETKTDLGYELTDYTLDTKSNKIDIKKCNNDLVEIKTDIIVNQIFNVEFISKDSKLKSFIVAAFNNNGVLISTCKKVEIKKEVKDSVKLNLELDNSVGNGECNIVIFDNALTCLSTKKVNIDRQIVADDDFGIFF